MSDTAIEDFIESAVDAALKSDATAERKRGVIRALYAFQDFFDTSFTMLRHKDQLCAIGFEEPSPENGLPPYEETSNMALPELALESIELSPNNDRQALILNWYACLVSRFIEFELDDAFLPNFQALKDNEALQYLRDLAIKADLRAYQKSNNSLFDLPSWARERDSIDRSDIDRYHVSRYLLDSKAEISNVEKAFEKDLKANSPMARKDFYNRIETAFASALIESMNFNALPRVESENDITWLYYRDTLDQQVVQTDQFRPEQGDLFQREFLRLTLSFDLGGLEVTAAVQNGQILNWQKMAPQTEPTFWHFYSNLFADIDEESTANKALNNFGLWGLKPGMTKKTESKRLASLKEQLEILTPVVFALYYRQFSEQFFKRKFTWFEKQWEDVIPTQALVSFLPDVLLLRAYNARENGKEDEAQSSLKLASKALKDTHPEGAPRLYLEPKIEEMLSQPDAPLSILIHSHSIKYLRELIDSQSR